MFSIKRVINEIKSFESDTSTLDAINRIVFIASEELLTALALSIASLSNLGIFASMDVSAEEKWFVLWMSERLDVQVC